MKRQQHTIDGKPVTHQDHFRCTITCGYCGKHRHYEDECHIKKRESDKLKRQEAERQKTQTPTRNPRMGIKVVKEVARGVAKVDPLTPRDADQRPLLLLLLPQVTPRSAHRGITLPLRGNTPRRGDWPGRPSPSWLQGWMSSSLMRSEGAAPKRRTWFYLDHSENWGSSFLSGATHRCNTFHSGPAPAKDFQENQDRGHKSRGWAYHPSLGGSRCDYMLGRRNCDPTLQSAGHRRL